MICENLSSILGFDCVPISEDMSIARIKNPFTFDDGESLPVYVQQINEQIRFFDDGKVLMHFLGRGMKFEDGRRTKFIKNAAEPHGVTLTADGDLEVWAAIDGASIAFTKFLSTLVEVTTWERDQRGVSTDLTILIDEIAMCLKAWKPESTIVEGPEFVGISEQVYKLDFLFDSKCIVATSSHPNSVSACIKKLLDVRSSPQNRGLSLLVVIDDRLDHQSAMKDSLVIQNVADVMPFTTLEQHAKHHPFSAASLPN